MGQAKLDSRYQVIREFTVGDKVYRPGGSIDSKKFGIRKVRILLNRRFIAPQPNV